MIRLVILSGPRSDFHPQKCQLLRIPRKRSLVEAEYSIHGHMLEKADTAKYLGVSLHKHCSWSPHIHQTAKKANNTRAFLQRNLRVTPTTVKKHAYVSLVRPILEHSGVVWDPHNAVEVNRLEMVQRRYAHYLWNDYGRTSNAKEHRLGTTGRTPCQIPRHHVVPDRERPGRHSSHRLPSSSPNY